ncbi:BON domain-containing protein [Gemmatimonas groenlandica]|uniref:BON domain-containing protein n=1 Tax=Gemmatimonas groenlandica TaxID=2732249 RepID=A0A6M4IXB4_9BACT|nr:BON domain-containing protein [Gemmatimonas groenlandica]QJR36821.1 BON domain-containing protein [Gemmatimonas groenlandica]
MSTSMPRLLDAHSFAPLSPPASAARTVFDNGVEAEISVITDRHCVMRDDRELLAASLRALRDASNVPKGRVVVSVNNGTVVLDGRTSYYYERAAAECAVRFLDGVRSVENHILVEPPALAHDVRVCIADALLRTAVDEATQIAVQAVGGTVILQGIVSSSAERDVAERAARTVDGVRTVIDNLIVST